MNNKQIYSNNGLDRAAHLREISTDTSDIALIPTADGQFFIHADNTLIMHTPAELANLSEKQYFLGKLDNKEVWCIDLADIEPTTIDKFLGQTSRHCVRDCFQLMSEQQSSLLTYAKGLSHWNNTHQFCGSCGTATVSEDKGHKRKCQNSVCGKLHFPRLDPAVIVLIEYKQEDTPLCLLNMRKQTHGYICSLFAGFTEIGESLEDTVKREVSEEVGLAVDNIRYIASQPWPFPTSMMLGFNAEAHSKSFTIDNKEIKEARWFSVEQIQQMVNAGELIISRDDSISNYLIRSWMAKNS